MEEKREALNALVNICELEQEKNHVTMSTFFDDLFILFHNYKNAIIPEAIESTYTGLHLNSTQYTETDFLKMINEFRDNKLIHSMYALKILDDSIKQLKSIPNINKCNLEKSSLSACIIVGDLHGSFKDLYYLIQKYDIPGKQYRFVFNGDFVDRGPNQCEVLLTLLYAFMLYPTRVYLNRGNHEDLSLNLNKHFKPNFNDDCMRKFNQYGAVVFKKAQELFTHLPLATILTNKVGFKCFIVHGGISNRIDLNFINDTKLMNRFKFSSISVKLNEKSSEQITDLLWSDPLKPDMKPYLSKNGCFPNLNRGCGRLFGEDISESFCKQNRFNTIVRSHEVRDQGWSRDHPFCFTIFSSSHYCHGLNKAAVLILNQNENKFQIHSFETDETNTRAVQKQKDHLLNTFKTYLEHESVNLIARFKLFDLNSNGWIQIKDWSNVISDFLKKEKHLDLEAKHLVTLKDYLVQCDETKQLANYALMFEKSIKSSNRHIYQYLNDIFSLIDTDHNGYVGVLEAKKVIEQMNLMLGTHYTTDFMLSMDNHKLNGHDESLIDINEFKEAFNKAFNLKHN